MSLLQSLQSAPRILISTENKAICLDKDALDTCAIGIQDAMNDPSHKIRVFQIYAVPEDEMEEDKPSSRMKIKENSPTMAAIHYLATTHGLECSTIPKLERYYLVVFCKPSEISDDPVFEGITTFLIKNITKENESK